MRTRVAFLVLVIILGCDTAIDPAGEGTLSLSITANSLATSADRGTVRLEGPATRTQPIQPGQTITFGDLEPGSYTVSLEAFIGSQLESFAQTSVSVVAGRDSRANLSLRSFIPAFVSVASQVGVGETVNVTVADVQGAAGYQVEWDTDPGFGSAVTIDVTGTTAAIQIPAVGQYYVRARARSRFGSLSVASPSSGLLAVPSIPVVTRYSISFVPVGTSCPTANRGLRTEEEFDYIDNGNVAAGGRIIEPAMVESEYRFQGQALYADSYAGKSWDFTLSSTGASGRLLDVGTTCWSMPAVDQTWVDVRVRIRDAAGNWSDWFETRLWLPASVTVSPFPQVALNAGQTVQISASARDVNGQLVVGDPINWSTYNGPSVGSISASGVYSLAAGVNGVDRVYARAGNALGWTGIQGPAPAGVDLWWAPCWDHSLPAAPQGQYRYYRMTVFQGRQYSLSLSPQNQFASGDPDLYVRLNTKPDTVFFDMASTGASFLENIQWTAPSNGVLWFLVHAWTSYQNVQLHTNTTDARCGYPAFETLPPSPPGAPALQMDPGPVTAAGGG